MGRPNAQQAQLGDTGSNGLYDFLKSRGIDEDIMRKMKVDKIDSEAVTFMDDQGLLCYIDTFGDRLTVFAYARQATANEGQNVHSALADRLREKLQGLKAKRKHVKRSVPQSENRNASKKIQGKLV